jgi:hypothetical protein
MGLQRFNIHEIEKRIATIVRSHREHEEAGNLSALVPLEESEEELWKAWHRAKSNSGYARI